MKMPLYYAGLNPSSLYTGKYTIEKFTKVPFADVTDVYIDWNYLLLWRYTELWITGTIGNLGDTVLMQLKELKIPDNTSGRCLSAIGDAESVTILTSKNEIWRYMLYEDTWKRIPRFIPSNEKNLIEEIVKMEQGKAVVALTNLGRVFNVPALVDMPEKVKFVDIACGIEHTVMLADNGDVYSMGLGTLVNNTKLVKRVMRISPVSLASLTPIGINDLFDSRGQLGHGDLEDSDEPILVEALAGLEVSQISASGWNSAVVTKEGDLYVWGWNNEGQMGVDEDQKVIAVPTCVDFKDDSGTILEQRIVKVQCASSYIVCLTENGELWGCGSNKYGQLGQEIKELVGSKYFIKLSIDLEGKSVRDFKCRARGTLIFTSCDDRV